MKILTIVLIVLVVGALFIVWQQGLNLKQPGDRKQLLSSFVVWTKNIFNNLKDITTDAMKHKWLPYNRTNSTNHSG